MKNLEELLSQTPVYLHNWKEKVDVIADFEGVYITNEDWSEENKKIITEILEKYKDVNILFASYGTDNWSGDAFVLFKENGTLYEVNGSHCSCYGLEGRWQPEEVYLPELENRLVKGTFGEDDWSGNEFKAELIKFLGISE